MSIFYMVSTKMAILFISKGPTVQGSNQEKGHAEIQALHRSLGFRYRDVKLPRRKFLHLAAGASALPAFSRIASALEYPTRPVRILVGFPAGTSPDIIARALAQPLSERYGRPFVVENRPGAGSNIATEAVVHAPPDGYLLLFVTATNAINTALYDNLNFNFIRDIAPVACVCGSPFVMLVNPSFPAKTVPEFIAYAKANPGKINMASVGNGTPPHVDGELFKAMTGADMTHVPYRSNPYADLLSGQVQVFFGAIASSIGFIRAGKLRALAVTGATRSELLPDIPTIGEFVQGYEASAWLGVGAPKNTQDEIVVALNKGINACLADPKMKAQLTDIGAVPLSMTPAGFGKLIADETEKWGKVIRTANIKPE
jgi:tripartite-type tricarboxylate transporter receptor subunit TctC